MSILDRLNLLIRSELNDIGRGSSFRNAMSEMEGSLRDARRQKAELRRSEAHLIKQIREIREKADRWEERAVLALKSGNEDLAREALVMKNRALDESAQLRDQLDAYRTQIQDIERALEALEMKLEGARGRIESSQDIDSRSSGTRARGRVRDESAWDAEMRRRQREQGTSPRRSSSSTRSEGGDHLDPLDDMVDDFGAGRAFQEFDRMSSKINAMEADIDAMRELADDDPLIDPRRRELEDIFNKLEKKKKSDDDLSDLKKKFQ